MTIFKRSGWTEQLFSLVATSIAGNSLVVGGYTKNNADPIDTIEKFAVCLMMLLLALFCLSSPCLTLFLFSFSLVGLLLVVSATMRSVVSIQRAHKYVWLTICNFFFVGGRSIEHWWSSVVNAGNVHVRYILRCQSRPSRQTGDDNGKFNRFQMLNDGYKGKREREERWVNKKTGQTLQVTVQVVCTHSPSQIL